MYKRSVVALYCGEMDDSSQIRVCQGEYQLLLFISLKSLLKKIFGKTY